MSLLLKIYSHLDEYEINDTINIDTNDMIHIDTKRVERNLSIILCVQWSTVVTIMNSNTRKITM